MGNLKRNVNRFFLRNRDKGIPNLILWVMAINLVVYVLSMFGLRETVYGFLCYNSNAILHGQIWRLVTFMFVDAVGYSSRSLGLLFFVMFLYVFYWISRALESIWGSFRFNRYYFSGILLTSLTALLVRVIAGQDYIMVTPYYINISLFLAVACLLPEERVLLFFIIPIKMRILALIDVGMVILELAQEYYALHSVYPAGRLIALLCTAPAIALLNFLLFLRGDVRNLSPRFAGRRVRKRDFVKTDARFTDEDRRRAEFRRKTEQPNADWAKNYRSADGEKPYHHKCTVCGRTDTSCPGLEFRYCSKCKGYFCYCIDHINNHTHIQ